MKQIVFLSLEYFKKHWKNQVFWIVFLYVLISAIGSFSTSIKLGREADKLVELSVLFEGKVQKDNGKYRSIVYGIFKDLNGEYIARPINVLEQHLLKPGQRYQVWFERELLDDKLVTEEKNSRVKSGLYLLVLLALLISKGIHYTWTHEPKL